MMTENLIFNNKNILLSVGESLFNFDLIKNYAQAEQLNRKREFHITLIGSAVSGKISDEQFLIIKELAKNTNWKFNLKQEYLYILKKYPNNEVRESIIQLINLPSLEIFYQEINNITEEQVELPVPHVTLFTKSNVEENSLKGIGIYSENQLNELSPRKLVV